MEKFDEAMQFYLLATQLTNRIRSGWDSQHWDIQAERIESIAEHVYSTLILAISIDSQFCTGVDLNRVLKMLTIHEIGEVLIGDITPFDDISQIRKEEIEHEAMQRILGNLASRYELYALLREFDAHETKESIFAYYCDKLQANIQAKWYQDHGCQKSLSNQKNNKAYKSDTIQKILKDGAETAFDVWYEHDKAIFHGDKMFLGFMDWLKNNDLSTIPE